MNRGKKMLLLVLVLAVVLVGYKLAGRTSETETAQEESGTFELTAQTADEVSSLSWTNDDTTYDFTRADGTWTKSDDASYPVSQDDLDELADSLISLKGVRKLENVTDASIYGLSEPAFSVTATWSDGSETVYHMGNATPFEDGYYLCLNDQSDTVYTIADSLSLMFDVDMSDLTQMEDVPGVENANRITVGTTLDASKQETSSTINTDQLWYAADGRPLDHVDDLVSLFDEIEWNSLVNAVANDDELAEWQLDDANAVAVSLYGADDSSATILFGCTNADGDYYARLPESTMVYTVAAANAVELLSATPESMISTELVGTDYEDVKTAVFTTGETQYTITADTTEKDAATEEKAATEEDAATEENAAVEAEAVTGEDAASETETTTEADDPDETLWDTLTAIGASAYLSEDVSDHEVVLTVSVTTKDDVSCEFSFAEYDADNYCVTDGLRTMLVDAASVDKLIRMIKSM